jgi:hypothetical protein
MVERPCWLCSLTLSCKALREALTTGGGGPAFYCTVHKYLRSLTTQQSLAPASITLPGR